MILELLPQLRRCRIVLASASPRRRELLERVLGLHVEVCPSTFAEDLPHSSFAAPEEYALATARAKAEEVHRGASAAAGGAPDVVISADSIVVAPDGSILEKAADAAQATQMLRQQSGRASRVITAVVLVTRGPENAPTFTAFTETTTVQFAELSDAEIAAYVAQPSAWQGKAGAYGIQDLAAAFIVGITGDYYTVMGFPLHRFSAEVRKLVDAGHIVPPS
jgi:septum formation protein